jgi:hypothetical protein
VSPTGRWLQLHPLTRNLLQSYSKEILSDVKGSAGTYAFYSKELESLKISLLYDCSRLRVSGSDTKLEGSNVETGIPVTLKS